MTISKELFEAVMGYGSGTTYINDGRMINWSNGLTTGTRISTNDFFFKCIDWLYDKGYKIRMTNFSFEIHTLKPWKPMTSLLCRRTADVNKNNTDALKGLCFDACTWILENKDD